MSASTEFVQHLVDVDAQMQEAHRLLAECLAVLKPDELPLAFKHTLPANIAYWLAHNRAYKLP